MDAKIYPSRRECLADVANPLPIWTAEVGGVVTWGRAKTEHRFALAMAGLLTIKRLTRDETMAAMQAELNGVDNATK